MGLLDQVIGNVVGSIAGQVLGGGRGGSALSPIAKALLMLLLTKGMSGGLGDLLGGGHARDPHRDAPEPSTRRRMPFPDPQDDGDPRDDGDLGGFGTRPGGRPPQEGDYSDLAGMLDGPGDRGDRGGGSSGGSAPEAGSSGGGPIGGGLGGLVESFERSGLGDVIGSWIGGGRNRPVAPNRLADALGPDTIDTLSRQTGLDRADLLDQLAQALPQVVDALTPQGRVPHLEEQRHW